MLIRASCKQTEIKPPTKAHGLARAHRNDPHSTIHHQSITRSLLNRVGEISQCLSALELCVFDHASISITREISRPLNERLSFMVTGSNWEQADSGNDAGVAELRLGRDDGVGYVVVDCRVSLKLNLQFRSVLENPLHNICVWGSALDSVALGKRGPEGAEGLELDEVPDGAEWGGDDG